MVQYSFILNQKINTYTDAKPASMTQVLEITLGSRRSHIIALRHPFP